MMKDCHQRRKRVVLSPLVVFALCVCSLLASVPVLAQRGESSSNRLDERQVWSEATLRALQGPKGDGKGPPPGKGKSAKKKGKGPKQGKGKGKNLKGKNALTLSPAPTVVMNALSPSPAPIVVTNTPTLASSTLSPTVFNAIPGSPTISPNLPPNAKSARRPSARPTTAPSLPSKVKSKTKKPTAVTPIRPHWVPPTKTGPTIPPKSKTKPTKNSTAADVIPTEAPSSPAFAFSRSIATGPVTIEYGGVLNLAQKEDAIFMAVESVLTPYLQQNVGIALRNYELTLTYTQGSSPNTYLSNIKVVLVLAGNSAAAVQSLTQDQANALLLNFFTGSTLKGLGDALLAAGIKVTTLGIYQPSGTIASKSTSSVPASGTSTNATGSKMGPTGYASIIAGGTFVILASVAIMHGRRRQSEPRFWNSLSKSKDDSTMTSSTEMDDGESSVKRMGIRPAVFPSRKSREGSDDMDLSATQQLIDKYRVLAPSVTELTDDFANQSSFDVRQASHDLSSDCSTWSLAYHDAVDPLDHMSVDSTDSMSTTDHQEFALAIRPAPSAELRMINGPDLIAATTLPGSAPWTARSYSFGSSISTTQKLEGGASTRSRRRWHDESEGEEVNLPEFTPSVKSDAGSVTSQN